MKITEQDYKLLSKYIDDCVNKIGIDNIKEHKKNLLKYECFGYKVKNADMCLRWDLLRASGVKIGDGIGVKGDINLYSYLDDSHIDTALKKCLSKYDF